MADNQPNYATNLARATLGQGLAMGWGDEAEAWLRSKLGDEGYDQALAKIRNEYGGFAKQHPIAQTLGEFAGGAAPGVAAMMIPGGQAAGAQQLSRSTLATLARLGVIGAGSGAVAGAGAAKEGERVGGAVAGGILGGVTGVGVPVALRGAGAGARWLRERLTPSDEYVQSVATGKLAQALRDAGLSPRQAETSMSVDRLLQVPSRLVNVSPATVDLARAVAQRTGQGAQTLERELVKQKAGARERTYQQVRRGLQPGDYYGDEQRLVEELRAKAGPAYDLAYSAGAVDDPVVNTVLTHPTFQAAFERGRKIAESQAMAAKLRGEDPSKYALPELYKPTGEIDTLTNTPKMALAAVPDVRTLDYVKRGLDDLIDAGYKGSSSVGKGQASSLRDLRNQFVAAIDRNVPEYRDVRRMYAGDMEVLDAMRAGYNDFGKLDHEQIMKMVADMSQAEKEAFRTGVARNLYGSIMGPSSNRNAAQGVIGSPETQAKLMPLFDTPEQFRLFKTALEREAQLFNEANRVLGGSQTAKTMQGREALESQPGVGEVVTGAITGSFWPSLVGTVMRGFNKATMTDSVAAKLADMLAAHDPHQVAAAVKLLEEHTAQQAPKALKATAAQAGTTTGLTGSVFPAPSGGSAMPDIENDLQPADGGSELPDIERDIANQAQ